MNLAAAGRTEAFGLFGSTPVLTYSKFIHAVVPPGGPWPGRHAAAHARRRCSTPSRPICHGRKPGSHNGGRCAGLGRVYP